MTDDELTERIIARAFKVHKALGPSFSEKVYENSMRVLLNHERIKVRHQMRFRFTLGVKWSESFFLICGSTGLLIHFGHSADIKRKFRTYKPKATAAGRTLRCIRVCPFHLRSSCQSC